MDIVLIASVIVLFYRYQTLEVLGVMLISVSVACHLCPSLGHTSRSIEIGKNIILVHFGNPESSLHVEPRRVSF